MPTITSYFPHPKNILPLFVVCGLLFSVAAGLPSMANASSSKNMDFSIGDSCTIFTAAIGDTVLFGNNEDYRLWGIYAWFMPAQELLTPHGNQTVHGTIYFGFDNNNDPADGYPQGGMNDQGLCFDGNGLDYYALDPHYERDWPYAAYLAEILWECSTIEDVIDWYLNHTVGDEMSYQIHFADASGDAMIVSAGLDEEVAFTRIGTESCLVSTNINVADTTKDVFDCWRYSTAMEMLTAISSESELTVDACRDVLNAVHIEGRFATKYSNVFDLVNRQIYLWYNHNFDQVAIMNLDDELALVRPGVSDYYEQDSLFGAIAADGNIYYRKIELSTPFVHPVPFHLVLLAAGIILLVLFSSVAIVSLKKRQA